MADLDDEIRGYYEDQELDEAALERLLAMESEVAPEAPRRRRWLPWLAGGAVAASALLVVGLVGTLAVSSLQDEMMAPLSRGSSAPRDQVVDTGYVGGAPRPYAKSDAHVRPAPRPAPATVDASERATRVRGHRTSGDRADNTASTTDRSRGLPNGLETSTGRFVADDVPRRAVPPHTATRVLATSTFAVDTDTAAWTRARESLKGGHLPHPDQVRTEELINAFRYDYEPPSSGPFAVHTEVVPSTFGSGKHLVRIGLQGEKVSVFERKPVHLTFLVDVSGSMNRPDKLQLAQQGMHALVGELDEGDTVAIVTYAGHTGVALQPTSAGDAPRIHAAIDRLTSGGGTSMGAGIDLAYGLAEQTLEPGAINRVVLLSDGDANIGERDPDRLAQRLRASADKGITLTTLGFGNGGYRDDVMERLANKGDGQYHFIANERDAQRVLVDDLTGMLQVIARDVKIQVELDPEVVKSWRLIGYENRRLANRDFRNDSVDAGEVGAGHQVTALYEVELLDTKRPLGELRLRWEAPGAEGAPAAERSYPLANGPRSTLSAASPDTRMAVVAATFAERLRGRSGTPISTLIDLLPDRPEYRERDGELLEGLRAAASLGLD